MKSTTDDAEESPCFASFEAVNAVKQRIRTDGGLLNTTKKDKSLEAENFFVSSWVHETWHQRSAERPSSGFCQQIKPDTNSQRRGASGGYVAAY